MQQIIFIADLIVCSTCFGHHYAHHQELESITHVVAACGIWCFGFQVFDMVWRYLVLWFSSCRYGVELRVMCPVCGLLRQQPANRSHNLCNILELLMMGIVVPETR